MNAADAARADLGWVGVLRLGLVQAALGSVVVLITSTVNRVMVVEYSMPVIVPGMLVALHYAVQMVRPRFGFESDLQARRAPWIVGGMAVLGAGGVLCAVAAVDIARWPVVGWMLAVVAYAMVGLGVGAAGTSLLVLLARSVNRQKRAAAATLMWILMIAGFAVTSTTVGHYLDPFSPQRLILACGTVSLVALVVTMLAVWHVERAPLPAGHAALAAGGVAAVAPAGARNEFAPRTAAAALPERAASARGAFLAALRGVWAEPSARRFTLFVFVSMLAYSAQELLLEPFAGLVFGYSLGESATLSGAWHAAALVGMIGVGLACSWKSLGTLRGWTTGGCVASALALIGLMAASLIGPPWPLRPAVIALGLGNGVFAVGAIGSMMELGAAKESAAGVRMGLWGAAQAVAFACGGMLATCVVGSIRQVFGSTPGAFAVVFVAESLLFLAAAALSVRTRDGVLAAEDIRGVPA